MEICNGVSVDSAFGSKLPSLAAALMLLWLCFTAPLIHAISKNQYAEALSKSILFFEGMRSGKLPADQRVTWRRDSALSDGSTSHVDLSGGYYDAGDNVKFGFPMAFTTTMLSWSVVESDHKLDEAGELKNAKNAVRWGSEYLLKAAATPNQLWVQVGDPNSDHNCWERPEEMDTPRPAYQVNAKNPGSDVAAETAAALAAASMVFQTAEPAYSRKLLSVAKKVFTFADRYRGAYSDVLKSAVSPFYSSYSGYKDELLWGAVWLYKASRDENYLRYIMNNGPDLGGTISTYLLSWDNKYCGAQVLLSKVFFSGKHKSLQAYKNRADDCVCSLLPGVPSSQATITPGGLLYHDSGSNLQYVTNAAFVLLTYSDYLASASQTVISCGGTLLTPDRLATFARRQVDYILGDNPKHYSYMVGFGYSYPQQVHHRASSLPSLQQHPARIQCGEGYSWFSSSKSNPNPLVGAVVGGPDRSDNYNDVRSNYQQAEPTTYINAALVGALAQLHASTAS
ncbi:hypothetical protein O6H91_05G024200 [Diphasiastrum complanatum]|uniref:Uncharacterized protein n=1 Tax=Diphasiastrum complanatum TaxID=34168 RepID=A0ACC2DLS5_DIPCM|nr:hypothetical protein O6H91_05G024200 [Diphasiastrum complanatum]